MQHALILRPGIQGKDMFYSWFSTKFDVPSSWDGQRVLLHFGAVDYEATVFVNGKKAGFNRGGYFHFEIDVTDHLSSDAENELYSSLSTTGHEDRSVLMII